MVSWSAETLLLSLYVIAILCASYVVFKTMRQSTRWGAFMVLTFGLFMLMRWYFGPLVAGIVVIAAQAFYIRKPYPWKTVGRIYVYAVLCWAGSTYIDARKHGWVPDSWTDRRAPGVQQAGTPLPPDVTESRLAVDGGSIWYRRSGVGAGTPVVLLHGGPGIGSFHLKALEALGDDRQVLRYDQLGAGHSDRIEDSTRYTVAHFVGDLDSLRSAMGYDRVHLVGHSWGAILGFEYYRAHPHRVASLTLASPKLSASAWMKNTTALLKTLPDSLQETITERIANRDYDASDYVAAMNEFNGRYVRIRPIEVDLDSTLRTTNLPMQRHMWGMNDFTLTGTLRTYDATRRLRRVKVPTLYTVGQFDEAGPDVVARFAKLTPGAKVEVISDAAHYTAWDNPAEMLAVVRRFLRGVDSARTAARDSAASVVAAGQP